MATKPTKELGWNPADPLRVHEPDSVKKLAGYVVEDFPYAHFNWMLVCITEWEQFVSDFYDEQEIINGDFDLALSTLDTSLDTLTGLVGASIANQRLNPAGGLTISQSFASIAALTTFINALPRNLNGTSYTLTVANAESGVTLPNLYGFFGGYINIYASSGLIDVSATFQVRNCSAKIFIRGNFQFRNATQGMAVYDCRLIEISECIFGKVSTSQVAGLYISQSTAKVYENTVYEGTTTFIKCHDSDVTELENLPKTNAGLTEPTETVWIQQTMGIATSVTMHSTWEDVYTPSFFSKYKFDVDGSSNNYSGKLQLKCWKLPFFTQAYASAPGAQLNAFTPLHGALMDIFSTGGVVEYRGSLRILGVKNGYVYFVTGAYLGYTMDLWTWNPTIQQNFGCCRPNVIVGVPTYDDDFLVGTLIRFANTIPVKYMQGMVEVDSDVIFTNDWYI
jgi:hypothetical protein